MKATTSFGMKKDEILSGKTRISVHLHELFHECFRIFELKIARTTA